MPADRLHALVLDTAAIQTAPTADVVAVLAHASALTSAAAARLAVVSIPAPSPIPDAGKVYTVAEAAGRLQVSRDAIYRRAGELGAVRVGRALRIPEAGIRAYLARRAGR